MAIYRQIQTTFWQDDFVLSLTPEEKYFYIYLFTNSKTKQCGIYELPLKIAELETGYNRETIIKLIQRFIEFGKIAYDWETKELAIKNWLKYNPYENNPKIEVCVNKEFSTVKNGTLIEFVKNTPYKGYHNKNKNNLKNKNNNNEEDIYISEQQKNFELIDFQAIRTLGRKLTFIEKEELEKYLIKFGEEMLVSQLRKAGMNNFKSIGTFLKNTNEKGFLILRDESDAEKLWSYEEKNKYIFDNRVVDSEYFEAVKIDGVMQGFRKIK